MLLHFNPQTHQSHLLGSVSTGELLLECLELKNILQQNSCEIIFAEILLEAVQKKSRVFGKHAEAANFQQIKKY